MSTDCPPALVDAIWERRPERVGDGAPVRAGSSPDRPDSVDRAVTPVLGTVLLIAVVLALGVLVAGVAFAVPSTSSTGQVSLGLTVDAEADRITMVHEGGDSIDVAALSVQVRIDDQPLDRQPPVPFFSARGFRPGPTGPFNSATDGSWQAGERGSFRLASTNDPTIDPGDTVTIRVYENDVPIAEVTTTA